MESDRIKVRFSALRINLPQEVNRRYVATPIRRRSQARSDNGGIWILTFDRSIGLPKKCYITGGICSRLPVIMHIRFVPDFPTGNSLGRITAHSGSFKGTKKS